MEIRDPMRRIQIHICQNKFRIQQPNDMFESHMKRSLNMCRTRELRISFRLCTCEYFHYVGKFFVYIVNCEQRTVIKYLFFVFSFYRNDFDWFRPFLNRQFSCLSYVIVCLCMRCECESYSVSLLFLGSHGWHVSESVDRNIPNDKI